MHAFISANDFTQTIRPTVKAGGCNCSRALFAGALAGAKYGLDGIPMTWIQKTSHAVNVVELAIEVMK